MEKNNNASIPAQHFSLLRALFLLTLFFLGIQISYLLATILTTGILHVVAVSAITWQVLTTPVVFIPFAIYLTTQLMLYTLFTLMTWYMAYAISKVLSLQPSTFYSLGIIFWIICAITILTANTIYFPYSIFALPISNNLAKFTVNFSYVTGVSCISIALLFTLWHLVTIFCYASLKTQIRYAFILLATITIAIYTHTISTQSFSQSHASANRPNIILVSIEALRPDFIFKKETMPFLAKSLASSIQFVDAYTPIAQSFPSWVSLLTGKTPLHNGARSFYTNYKNINMHDSLVSILNQRGYETIYAVDGQRFGDITTELGFQRIISPPTGAAELLIGSISDFPLSNLVLNTPINKFLFPYSYANRSIVATYHPDDFTDLLTTALRRRTGKPLFLSVHFGLSHWPYHWADDHIAPHQSLARLYQYSLRATDQQIKQFFTFLNKEDLLKHAIVVFFSDHGTGLGLSGDSLTNPDRYVGTEKSFKFLQRLPYSNNKKSGIDTSYGYSTNILSMQQYKVLLAIQLFGFSIDTPKKVTARSSLLDIKPTILSLLNIHDNSHTDGISLVDAIRHSHSRHTRRKLFLENGFTSPEIAQPVISAANVLSSSAQSVNINPASGLLYITKSAQSVMLKHKQRALLIGDWLLARVSPEVMVLANISSGEWTTEWDSSLAKSAPLQDLMHDFNQYNSHEI